MNENIISTLNFKINFKILRLIVRFINQWQEKFTTNNNLILITMIGREPGFYHLYVTVQIIHSWSWLSQFGITIEQLTSW